MKRPQLLLLTLLGTLGLQASPSFDQAKRYHIVCRQWTQGCVTDGNSANQQTPVYYLTTATEAEETYWIFTEEETNQYTIKNAKTGKYITYDGVRDTYRRYRDYSVLATAVFYLLQVIDANVFAYMQDFEVTDEISFRMEPSVIPDNYALNPPAVGMTLGIKF